ncbi:hypothetical protein [Clostridium tarantellae]|uniref:Uncharacterized protein n=1 Tax=Clostridium tarantellae TaxID=39493 RepID=A0A6I1MM55_9CLOT|nr:hypothetical protein [Clostridium tarantellae]MPQ44455.1 hypothetical protein [Clostridium tarantellae]
MSRRELFVWFMCCTLGTWYVYFYGMKKSLMELRTKKGIIDSSSLELYNGEVSGLEKKYYFKCKTEMLLFTVFIVLCTVSIFKSCTSVDFTSFAGVGLAVVSLFFLLSLLVEAPIEGQFSRDKKHEVLLICFGKIKMFMLNKIVNKEYSMMRKSNEETLRIWIKDKGKIGALIIKLNGNTFIRMLPKDISDECLEELTVNFKEIAELYLDNYEELYDAVKLLFDKDLLSLGMKICDISSYLRDHNLTYNDTTIEEIKEKIRKKISKNEKSVYVNEIGVEEVDELLNGMNILIK